MKGGASQRNWALGTVFGIDLLKNWPDYIARKLPFSYAYLRFYNNALQNNQS